MLLNGHPRTPHARPSTLLLLVGTVAALPAAAQGTDRVRVSGYVRDRTSGELIRAAQASIDGTPMRTETNQDGFFTMLAPAGRVVLRLRAIGYRPSADTLDLRTPLVRTYTLEPATIRLEDLTTVAQQDSSDIDPALPEMSVVRLDALTLRQTPAVLGEVDPIRTLTLLPGVKTTSDGSTGISVRGGTPDQNLILLDESTIYNPAHVFGFFSVFNSDAVDDVKLYKGDIPARYGGRLSSVLDIRQREGSVERLGGSATVGLVASRATVEGPLFGGRGSFLAAGRRTYADLFLRLSSDPDINRNVAYFYDANLKANYRLGDQGALMVSGYLGRDRFGVPDRFRTGWGNTAGTLRWTQAFGPSHFSRVTATASDYDYNIGFFGIGRDLDWTAGTRSIDLRTDQTFYLGANQTLTVGADAIRLDVQPGRVRPVGASSVTPVDLQPRQAWGYALHAEEQIELGERLSIRGGVRWAGFARVGRGTVYRYADDAPVVFNSALGRYQRGVVTDSTVFGGGDVISAFSGLEPRLSLRLGLGGTSSLKASFARTRQYLQLVSNTNSPTPLDIWEPAGPYVRPQTADQVAVGLATTRGGGRYEFSAEVYAKRLSDVPDFVPGADVTLNDRIETELLLGRGRAYGIELLLRKRTGLVTGWVGYTLARSERRLPGLTPDDPGVNDGAWYPSPYDKTHDLSVVLFRPLGTRWTLGSTFVVQSGLPITAAESRYTFNGLVNVVYGPRNAERLPLYHRLDLTLTRRWSKSELQFGLFNVYNRFNAQSLSFRQAEAGTRLDVEQTSIFGIVPSISFTRRF